jgi:hypothetical protein
MVVKFLLVFCTVPEDGMAVVVVVSAARDVGIWVAMAASMMSVVAKGLRIFMGE